MAVFDLLDGFGRVHHRFLANRPWLRALVDHVGIERGVTEVAEGDICWYTCGKRVTAVFGHPDILNRIPRWEKIEPGVADGTISKLEDVLVPQYSAIPKIIELKHGTGDIYLAIEHILGLLEDSGTPYWIDSFSPRLLKVVKTISPNTRTSLHTRLGVYGPWVIKTNYEVVPFSPRLIRHLDQVDAITVTYKHCPARFLRPLGATIDSIHKYVTATGRALIFGGVESPEVERLVRESQAIACYHKWDTDRFKLPRGVATNVDAAVRPPQ